MPDEYSTPSLWKDKPEAWHEVMPGVKRRILGHSSTGMMVYYKIDSGKIFPRHNHPHAQFGVILEGEALFNIEGREWPAKPGDTYFIPPGMFHEFRVIGSNPATVIDFFTPERDDYLAEALPPDKS